MKKNGRNSSVCIFKHLSINWITNIRKTRNNKEIWRKKNVYTFYLTSAIRKYINAFQYTYIHTLVAINLIRISYEVIRMNAYATMFVCLLFSFLFYSLYSHLLFRTHIRTRFGRHMYNMHYTNIYCIHCIDNHICIIYYSIQHKRYVYNFHPLDDARYEFYSEWRKKKKQKIIKLIFDVMVCAPLYTNGIHNTRWVDKASIERSSIYK